MLRTDVSLPLLMGAVGLAPVVASLAIVVLTSGSRDSQVLIGSLGALFGFLLGLVAVFCGVMLPLASAGLSGEPGNGAGSLLGATGTQAGIAAVVAVVLSCVVTWRLSKAIVRRERQEELP